MSYEKDNKLCRQHLKQTDPSLDRERILSAKGTLLRESYSWVIDHPQFQDWKTNLSHRRLWVRGDAGKGKTMLLCGIIEELEKDPFSRLCYFFCQATDENLRDGICVLRGLLFHLIKQYPWLISHVRKDYDDSGEKLFNDHNAWQALQKIFKSVLNDEGLDEVIIIVDALDECMVHREELLQFICDISASSRAKLVVSSRPFVTIQKALQDDGTSSSTLALELNDELISDAVKRFIKSRVRDLEKKRPYQNDHDICEKVTKHLTDNAESTFLWVALVCKELSSRTVCRKEHVYAILKNSPPGLNNLYDRMLESIRSESRDFAICLEILATSSVVKRPVTVAELICILDPKIASEIDTQELEQIIMSCGSFLHLQKGTVYFIHQSAVDFLLEDRSSRFPRITNRHRSVFRNALYTLQASPELKRDIYTLQNPGVNQHDIKTPDPDPLLPICYSCIHWVDHLRDHLSLEVKEENLGPVTSEEMSLVCMFLKTKFLFWVEALSLLRNIPQAIKSMQKLQKTLGGKSTPSDQTTNDFVDDANRFLMYHRYIIEECPLQLYAGCLVFSPKDSIVKNCFQSEAPKWVTVTPGLDSTWDACLQTLDLDKSSVLSVAYSPDDQWFVSGSRHGTIKLWDAESGICIHTCHADQGKYIDHVAFSADGKSFVSVAHQGKYINHVAFSADGKSFVSVAVCGSVAIWDRLTGNLISKYHPPVSGIAQAISSDGLSLAYVLREDSILIWTGNNETTSHTFPCSKRIEVLALSAEGKFLVTTASGDLFGYTIWNISRGEQTAISTDYKVWRAAFSAEGQLLATSGDEHWVEIWEEQAGQWISKMKTQGEINHDDEIFYIAFSTDKTLVAAASLRDISVWNTGTGALIWAVNDIKNIYSISFSNDNSRLLSVTPSYTVKVWDLSKATDSKSLHDDGPDYFCWSDAEHLVAVHYMEEISIHSRDTSNTLHTKPVSAIAISQDSHQLASASLEGVEITIWDIRTGKVLRRLNDSIGAALFDSEHTCRAQKYGSQRPACDTAVVKSGQTTGNPRPSYPEALAFGSAYQLASSVSGLIKIWDTSTGHCLQTIFCDESRNSSIALSKTGQWLAVLYEVQGSRELIKLYNTVTKKWKRRAKTDRTFYHFEDFAFSADGQQFAATTNPDGSAVMQTTETDRNPIMQVWDVCSGDSIRSSPLGKYGASVCFDSKNPRLLHTQLGSFDMMADAVEVDEGPRGYGPLVIYIMCLFENRQLI
ncbi:nacht and wd domain [Fusarium sporotrichioides]|uniref:Nacht and wd domain n=1 Tax=Fusarium sporotrichioides TaxID=5514 RepID=A0A395S1P0_FUSSP|nr:nacht and wd domain [Fusarium sporotrichioides]